MTTKTFNEIRDFCLTDGAYREYYDVPPPELCSREQWEHYYKDLGDGTTWCGTGLFGRSQERLTQFLGQEPPHILLTLDIRNFEVIAENPHDGWGLTASARVCGFGVQVEFPEPFIGPFQYRYCHFEPQSDRPFSAEGVAAEVKDCCERHFLLPPGRYRDLQIAQRWPKRDFFERYRKHRENVAHENDYQHRKMLDRYAHARFMSDEEVYKRLEREGVFATLNCDEDERTIMAEALAAHHNKQIYNEIRKNQKHHLP